MGYILPVNNYQSQQYANRLLNDDSYSRISKLQRVNRVEDFMNHYEDVGAEQSLNPKIEEQKPAAASNPKNELIGYIHPNPANLSGELSKFVDKEAAFNAYN